MEVALTNAGNSCLPEEPDIARIHAKSDHQCSMAMTSTMASLLEGMRIGWNEVSTRPLPYALMVVALMAVSLSVRFLSRSDIPHLNPKAPFEFSDARPKQEFVVGARSMLGKWFASNPGKPVRVIADYGEVTVLPPEMANEIRNDERLSFSSWVFDAFHAHLPGFEGFREGSRESHILQSVILRDLTKQLSEYLRYRIRLRAVLILPRQSHRASDGGNRSSPLRNIHGEPGMAPHLHPAGYPSLGGAHFISRFPRRPGLSQRSLAESNP